MTNVVISISAPGTSSAKPGNTAASTSSSKQVERTSKLAPSSASSAWKCTVCTVPNHQKRTHCFACESKKSEPPTAAFLQIQTAKKTGIAHYYIQPHILYNLYCLTKNILT